ncbi:S-layer homology domain-containing protein [Paenibacillus macerans]|uniref:S-layer homology domain-containing protein n=1 Tax=Paenibacillus macerans TaxID=44252 RepID=UPI003D317110
MLKRIFACFLVAALTASGLFQPGGFASANEAALNSGAPLPSPELIVTEAYIDDIDRPEWVPTGVSTFDPMEYVEIYNAADKPINFSGDYGLYHFRKSANKEYSLPVYGETEEIIIPARSSIVLWGFLASRYTNASADQVPGMEDFRLAFGIGGDVPVYRVNTSSSTGFYNTYNGSFRIKKKDGTLVSESAFTPATDSADGKSIEFRMPAEGTLLSVYRQKADPTPGTVAEEQYTTPPVLKEPVIRSIDAKESYGLEEAFAVSADIEDAQQARLFFKQNEATGYQQLSMTSEGNGKFEVSVPRSKLWGETLTWHIEAYNDTKSAKSEDKTAQIEYPYDPAKQPQVLMTELKTEDTGYNYVEYYNNADHAINFVYYNVFYEYPSGLSYKYWTFDTNALMVEPGGTLVVWINDDDGKTVEQFNEHYGVQLEENKSIMKVNYSGMSPNDERTLKLGNTYENFIVAGTYHEDEMDDTAKATSIHYTYSRDNGIRMVKADSESGPTPGRVEDWQVPAERAPFDHYGGYEDDESTMVLKPREEIPESIKEGEALNVAFDLYDTATGVNTIETYYKFDDEENYRVMMDKRQRIAKQFITSIPASEFLGHKKVRFYLRAYNAFRYYDTPEYEVAIRPGIAAGDIGLNVSEGQILSDTVSITATAGGGDGEIGIKLDGREQTVVPMIENGAYFSYKTDNLTSYYKNAITVGGDVIKLLSSWANVNQKAAQIDSRYFVKKDDGDYEITVTVRSGSQGSPFEENDDHAAFAMSQMALYLPNGLFVYPDNGIEYAKPYTIGDGSMALDVHFTVPEAEIKARGFVLNTSDLPDGKHIVEATAGAVSKTVSIIVDNMPPEIDLGVADGQVLRSGDEIAPQAYDESGGIDDTKTVVTLDGEVIQPPFKISGQYLQSGEHTLAASYTDNAGQTAQRSVVFTADIRVPLAEINEVEQTKSRAATLSVQLDEDQASDVTVEFLEGQSYSLAQKNIRVTSGAGDDPLGAGGSDSLISASDKELPYQLFRIETGELTDDSVIEADWQGSSDAAGTLQMFALNVAEGKWDPVAAAEQGRLSASFKAKDHVKEGQALLLVQNRSQGSYPFAGGPGVSEPPLTGQAAGEPAEWDGTEVPERYDFSFAWISDPQYYVESWPDHYMNMNRWIIDKRDRLNIKYTINTGDLIDEWDRDEQWKIADAAQRLLDDSGMPNGVLAGNHDVASGNEEYGSYWKYFGEERYKHNSYYGGSYRNNLGHYDLISAGGQDFIILYMSWDVYQPEVDWMNEVLAKYPERKAIIAMHRYLKQGGTLDYAGELVQNEVVAKNPNVFAVINGHYFGAAIKIDGFDDDKDGVAERKVYQICTDYQGAVEGGLQYLKMLYFDLENNKVYMNAYSPYLDDFNYFDQPKLDSYDIGVTASSQDIYELDVPFNTELKTLKTENIRVDVYTDRSIGKRERVSGQVDQVWEGLTPDTEYQWYANIADERGEVYRTAIARVRTPEYDQVPTDPAAPVITSVVPGDGQVEIGWAPVADATGYKIFVSSGPIVGTVSTSVYGDQPFENELMLEAGPLLLEPAADTVSSAVYAEPGPAGETATGVQPAAVDTVPATVDRYRAIGLTNGVTYYFAVKAIYAEGEGPYSNEVSAAPATVPGAPTAVTAWAGSGKATVSFTAPADDGGSLITGYIVTASPGGITATGNGTTITIAGLRNGTEYTFTVKAVNRAGSGPESAPSNAVTPHSSIGGGSGGGTPSGNSPGSPVTTKAPETGTNGVRLFVNGSEEDAAATYTTAQLDGKTVMTVALDTEAIENRLKQEGDQAKVTVQLDAAWAVVDVQMSGQAVKSMEARASALEIKTAGMVYLLPATRLGQDRMLPQLGSAAGLPDTVVNIKLSKVPGETSARIEETARAAGYRLLAEPIGFAVTYINGDTMAELDRFGGYVERTMALTEGDISTMAVTGAVWGGDGDFSPMPTAVTAEDGQNYARISSMSNGTFVLLGNSASYTDTGNHWSREAVEDLGSRLIVNGVGGGKFAPDKQVTRAELAAVIVRGLGLTGSGTEKNIFRDVTGGAWYYDEVSIAYEQGLLTGDEHGSFRPMEPVSREQAMAMIARAMSIAGLEADLAGTGAGAADEVLAAFGDAAQMAGWAKEAAAVAVKSGIVTGLDGGKLAPQEAVTRAQAAVMVRRLLQKSELIDY